VSAPEINLEEWTEEELVDGVRYLKVYAVMITNNLPEHDRVGELYFQVTQDGPYKGKIICFKIKGWKPVDMLPQYIDPETGELGEVAKIKYMTIMFDPQTSSTTAWLDMIEQKCDADIKQLQKVEKE
jgi:hypothetical protein